MNTKSQVRGTLWTAAILTLLTLIVSVSTSSAAELAPGGVDPLRGWFLLTSKPYMAPDFDSELFGQLWKVWPKPLRDKAKNATPGERHEMAFRRYGLVPMPEDAAQPEGAALGYVRDENDGWVMNCLACHGGKVAGRVIPGLANTHFAFQTLSGDIINIRRARGEKLSQTELIRLFTPLGKSNGTTNAQVFSVTLAALRDIDLNYDAELPMPKFEHHDLDAPPLWNVKKKSRLYIDGFIDKSPRAIMQVMMVPENDAWTLHGWENDYADVLGWIESLEPPEYPWEIDRGLAAQGKKLFEQNCAECHGTYGPDGEYPERMVDIAEVGTDDLRLRGMPDSHRKFISESWLGDYGKTKAHLSPPGYIAPPLDGIWASAPYLHNGSVPTLWHLFHVEQRPVAWRRTEDGYDQLRVGLEVEAFDTLPESVKRGDQKRQYFDTRMTGKSAAGHEFPEALTEDEKPAVIEYLKTL